MRKNILLLLLIIGISFLNNLYANEEKTSSIVKIITYKDIFGKYIEKTSLGSALIINKDGYILTSSNSIGENSDYINICLVSEVNNKTDCSYTATLIEQNDNLGVAILKIDSKDIFGNIVDFSKLSFLEIDYNYESKIKNEVYILGYNLIDSITKVKSLVTDVLTYGDNEYIKTDIWSSDGIFGKTLLSKEGKIIGIQKSLTGEPINNWDSYIKINGLKSFIDSNIAKNTPSQELTNFIENKKLLDKVNIDKKISDLFFNFSFPNDYEVKRYFKDKNIVLIPNKKDESLIKNLEVSLEKIPNIKDENEFLSYLNRIGFYDNITQKLDFRKIGGIDFYIVTDIFKTNIRVSEKIDKYIARVGENNVIFLTINKPVFNNSDKDAKVKSNLDKLITSISFYKEKIKDIKFDFQMKSPFVTILTGSILSENLGFGLMYYGNLYDYFKISVKELKKENGKGKTIEEIYENDTKGIEGDYKSMIKFLGHKGYIYCDNSFFVAKNEAGKKIEQRLCVINIYENIVGNNNKEYYLNGILLSDKDKMIENIGKTIDYLKNNLEINKIGDSITKIPNIYNEIVPLSFNDIKYQSDNYKLMLKKLIKYNLIDDGFYLNPDEPIKWDNFIYNYFRFKYNYVFNTKNCIGTNYTCFYKNNYVEINGKKTSFYNVFREMKIPLNYYVDYEKANIFTDYIDLKLVGVKSEFSEEWFKKYDKLKKNSVYNDILEKVDLFYNKRFGTDKKTIYNLLDVSEDEDLSYFQTKNSYFSNISLKIFVRDLYKKGQYDFSSKNKIDITKWCSGNYINKCYRVMTKSMMIDLLVPKIDFTIFDETLE
ncbi:MAG: serine protease [Candidatus Gracilibacteria bacterium]